MGWGDRYRRGRVWGGVTVTEGECMGWGDRYRRGRVWGEGRPGGKREGGEKYGALFANDRLANLRKLRLESTNDMVAEFTKWHNPAKSRPQSISSFFQC